MYPCTGDGSGATSASVRMRCRDNSPYALRDLPIVLRAQAGGASRQKPQRHAHQHEDVGDRAVARVAPGGDNRELRQHDGGAAHISWCAVAWVPPFTALTPVAALPQLLAELRRSSVTWMIAGTDAIACVTLSKARTTSYNLEFAFVNLGR